MRHEPHRKAVVSGYAGLIRPTAANWVCYDPFGDGSILFPEDGCTFTLQPGWATAGSKPLLNENYKE